MGWYYQTIKNLEAFRNRNSEHKRKSISFNDIDLDFYNQFYHYLEKKNQLGKNTIGTNIKNIKVFMKQSLERSLHSNQSFRLSGFKVVSEETNAPYLSASELKKNI